jgi:hypothetical protein
MDDIATNVHSQITMDSSGLDINSSDALWNRWEAP